MNEHCADHLATLLRLIERGDEVPSELKSHLATCAECARLLEAMHRVQTDIERDEAATIEEPVVADTVDKSAATIRRSSRSRMIARTIAGAVVVAAAAASAGWMIGYDVFSPGEGRLFVGIVFVVAAVLFMLVAVVHLLRRHLQAPGRALYKRLKPGRQIDGVCLGLAEATGVPVLVMRVIFIALFFVNGAGFWLYILFALLMPTHPDDRQYLLRFQIARAFRRVTSRR